MNTLRIALVGDFDASIPAHQAIPLALKLAAAHHRATIQPTWVDTTQVGRAEETLSDFAGVWCVPGSPYRNTRGALNAIHSVRMTNRPFLGTCGGFQHALLEYAENVLGIQSPVHAELDPSAPHPLIEPLTCSLVEKSGALFLQRGSLMNLSYGVSRINEQYRCSYGLNPAYETALFAAGLRATARDKAGHVHGIELAGHCFFVGTLFQSERRALRGEFPPLVRDFVGAIASCRK